MGAQSFGGIRSNGGAGRYATTGGPLTPSPAPPPRTAAAAQPGSPYGVSAPVPFTSSLLTHHTLMVLVVLEAIALVALRHGFRHHHGG